MKPKDLERLLERIQNGISVVLLTACIAIVILLSTSELWPGACP